MLNETRNEYRSYARRRRHVGSLLTSGRPLLAIVLVACGVTLLAPVPLAKAGCEEGCADCETCKDDECVPCEEGQCCQKRIDCEEGCDDPEECCGEVSECVDKCDDGSCPEPDACPPCPGDDDDDPPDPPGTPPGGGGGCGNGVTNQDKGCVDNGDGTESCHTSSGGSGNPTGGCNRNGGGGSIGVHSLRASFDLGLRTGGQRVGALAIRAEQPSAELCTTDRLYFTDRTPPDDVEIISDGNDALRQVKTPQLLADIVTIDPYAFEIRFYDKANWGTKAGSLYVPVANGDYVAWRIENPDGANARDRISISKKVGGTCEAGYLYEYDGQTENWTLYSGPCSGPPLRTERLESVYDTQAGTRDDTRFVYEGSDLVYQASTEYTDFGWGYVETESVVGTGNNAIVTTRDYYTNDQEEGKYKKLKSWTDADGSWQMRDYDTFGRKTYEWRPWKDTPVDDVDTGPVVEIKYEYTRHVVNDYGTVEPMNPRTVTESLKLSGKGDISPIVLARTYHAYYMDNGLKVHVQKRCPNPANIYSASGNLVTTRSYEPAGEGGTPPERLASMTYEDGRHDIFTYDQGTYSRTGDPSDANLGSFAVSASGEDVRVTVVHEGASGPVDDKTTKTVTVADRVGRTLVHETYVYDGSGYARVDWTVLDYDAQGRATDTFRSNGTHEESSWSDCCGLTSYVGATGVEISYDTYDAIGRLTRVTREGVSASGSYPAQADIVTEYARGATASRFTLTTTTTGGTSSLQTSTQYDLAGRITATTDPSGLATTRTYSYTANGNYVETVDPPDGPAVITEYYLDGRIKSIKEQIGQNQVVREYYDYGVTSGLLWTRAYQGPDGTSSPAWAETTVDALGRVKQERRPGYNSSTVTTDYTYNNLGQLSAVSTTGMADTLYEYDAMGNQVRSGLDVGGNGQLDLASTDRITDKEEAFYYDGVRWWQRSVEKVYATSNDNTPTTVRQQLYLLTGFDTNETQRTKTIDVHGNETITSTVLDRTDWRITVTVNVPDSTSDTEQVRRNGLLQSETTKEGLTTAYTYDDLGRRTGVRAPRHSASTVTTYYAGVTGKTGRIHTVTDPAGNATTYDYDTTTGRRKSVTDADNKTRYFAYTARGALYRQWGDTSYPVQYEYDEYGRMVKTHAFRAPESGGTPYDFTGDTWPNTSISDPPVSDDDIETTTWAFEEATGLLTAKTYDDGNAVSYTYTSDGQLDTRTWARSSGGSHVTDYSYDSNTGELIEVDYADGTPDVTVTYDRRGRKKTVADVVGTRTFAYNAYGELTSETIDGSSGGLYSKTIMYRYEDTNDPVPGRYTGYTIASDTVTYGYDTTGQLNRVNGPGLPGSNGGVFYDHTANSDLIGTLTYKDTSGNAAVSTTRTYELNRDVLTSVENKTEGATPVSKYTYVSDALGRRTAVIYTGSAFATPFHVDFAYNPRSELTRGDRRTGQIPDEGAHVASPFAFDYAYDLIGNRETYEVDNSGTPTAYSTNDLSQYTATTNPTESFSHDEDGNLTADGTYTYTWDSENRLIGVEPPGTPVNGDEKVEFAYDHQSRRVRKTSYTYNGSAWVEGADLLFVYDELNVVLVLDANTSNATVRKYTWGLDLSGLQGAGGFSPLALISAKPTGLHTGGGVGGLLAVEDVAAGGGPSHSYWFFYDANGNVGQLIKASDCSLGAHYEYDPYNNAIAATGPYASANPFRFSTKWLDGDVDLYYCNLRYYRPASGRWINSDPLEEYGGLNLYAFVHNDPIDSFDSAGLRTCRSVRQKTDWTADFGLPYIGYFKCKFQSLTEIKECDICCQDGRREKLITGQQQVRINCKIEAPIAIVMGIKVSVFGSGQGGGKWTWKYDPCTGKATDDGCYQFRIAGGIQGCGDVKLGKLCIIGEVFYRQQWCAGSGESSCYGGRIMGQACFGKGNWRCWEYVIYERNTCGADVTQ